MEHYVQGLDLQPEVTLQLYELTEGDFFVPLEYVGQEIVSSRPKPEAHIYQVVDVDTASPVSLGDAPEGALFVYNLMRGTLATLDTGTRVYRLGAVKIVEINHEGPA